MTVTWDRTILPIECESDVSEDDLWSLHRDLWTLAFPALGQLYESMLHDIAEGVTMHPKNPELWFYRGRDDDEGLDSVSRTELRYGFPADEFNNPTFEYEVVHHWFRLGLAVAFERAIAMAAKRGIRIEVPSLREELSQEHWRLVRIGSAYRQVVGKGESFSLFSPEGWTRLEKLDPSYHDAVREVGTSGCGCMFCARFRRRARSILERKEWESLYAALRSEHSDLALFVAVLQRGIAEAKDDPGRYDWALTQVARDVGAKAVGADPEAASVLVPFLETPSVASAPAALAVAIAFVGAKSKPRIAMLPLLKSLLAMNDLEGLGRAVRVLMPDKFMTKAPILKKHLDDDLRASLATLPDRLAPVASLDADRYHKPLQASAAALCVSAVIHRKPTPEALDVVRAYLSSKHPIVRAAVASKLRFEVSGYSGEKHMKPYFELAVEVACNELHPEHLLVLLQRPDELPAPLIDAIVALLPTCDPSALHIEDVLAQAAEKVPALKAT